MPGLDEEKAQVDAADPPDGTATLDGLHDTVMPVDGVVDAERPRVSAKPPWLANVMVDVVLEPDWKPNDDGLADIVKSRTLMEIWME